MRRTIIILVVLLFAGSAYASEPYPVDYKCIADASRPKEAEFCTIFKVQLALSGLVVFDIDKDRPYFQIIVLPTTRGGYLSVTVASNFIYPPLAGLALSAYISSYIVIPSQAEELERCAGYMVGKNLTGISEWMLYFEGKFGPSPTPGPLEVRRGIAGSIPATTNGSLLSEEP